MDKEGKEQLEIEITVDTEALNSKEETERNFLLMSIAYAANIGGTGVVTGTSRLVTGIYRPITRTRTLVIRTHTRVTDTHTLVTVHTHQ